MKNFRIMLIGFLALIVLIPGWSWALSLTSGAPIIAIDGNSDGDVAVYLLSTDFSSYSYGYYLNGGATFIPLVSPINISTFLGGDVIDFALYDGLNYYSLSGDSGDSSYGVAMDFIGQVTTGSPQQPAGWSDPYYYDALMIWSLPNTLGPVVTNELALQFSGPNDGVAPYYTGGGGGSDALPTPEPSTLLLLGSGLTGLGIWRRMRKG